MSAGRLSETHRKTIGNRLAAMQQLIAEVRELGFDSDPLTQVQTELARIDQEVGAIRPRPPPGQVRASLAQLLLLTYELRPRALGAYGALDDDEARYLEQQSARLTGLVERAVDEWERESE